MLRFGLLSLLLLTTLGLLAQVPLLTLKKRNKVIKHFYLNSRISFQLKDGEWVEGIITDIRPDSFYLKTERITYTMMGADTVHFSGFRYALSDVYAMPKKGLQLHYVNNRLEINRSAGHMHFYWFKSGWLFRTAAIGYVGLDAANGLIHDNFKLAGSKYGLAAGVFAAGMLMKYTYKVTFRLGRKYSLRSELL